MGWVVRATTQPPYTWKRDPVAIVQEAKWAQGWSGQVWKISPPLVFDPWTILLVASCYTCCAVLAPNPKVW